MRIKRRTAAVLSIILAFHSGMTGFAAEKRTDDIEPEKIVSEQDETEEESGQASEELERLSKEQEIFALLYLCDEYEVRKEPGEESEAAITVPSGQQMRIESFAVADESLWYEVSFYVQGMEYRGYVPGELLACSDERFLAWEKKYFGNAREEISFYGNVSADVGQFPYSYQLQLQNLKKQHPNWTFVKMNTGLDWNTVVREENKQGRSLVQSSSPSFWKNGEYGDGWSYASEGILKYYLDPRNFLNETYVFQFEQLTYNQSYHTENALQKFLSSTFMAGEVPGEGMKYSKAFWTIGSELGVSPFHLAARVYQEQGAGNSVLISGAYPGYEGLYNYYNIGATGQTRDEIVGSGLERARSEGWTTRYLSLKGGSAFISKNYILRGQDTLYLQKFDVDGSDGSLYAHQYMQNICAPSNEGINIRKLYQSTNSLDNTFVFKIPVYGNMPETPCPQNGAVYKGTDYTSVFDPDYYYRKNPDLQRAYGRDAQALLKHFAEQGVKEGRQGNEEFNPDVYKLNYRDLQKAYGNHTEQYYHHYIVAGKYEGRNAKTLQNGKLTVYRGVDYAAVYHPDYYYGNNPDLQKAYGKNETDLIWHFVEFGRSEGRQGNAEFNPKIYQSNYPDLQRAYGNNMKKYYEHYMSWGKSHEARIASEKIRTAMYQGIEYASVFDADYYYKKNPDLQRAYGHNEKALLKHFVEWGSKVEGRQGNAEFNPEIYKKNYTDLQRAYGNDRAKYYWHYIVAGKVEGRNAASSKNGKLTVYKGKDYAKVYDADYYYANHPDLQRAYGKDESDLLWHFVEFGRAEGRQGNAEFNPKIYQSNYPDLQKAYGNDLKKYYDHYMIAGKNEARIANEKIVPAIYNGLEYAAVFDADYYYANNPDLQRTYGHDERALLKHFAEWGSKVEGRQGNAEFNVHVYASNYRDLRNAYGDDLGKYYWHYIVAGKREGRSAK